MTKNAAETKDVQIGWALKKGDVISVSENGRLRIYAEYYQAREVMDDLELGDLGYRIEGVEITGKRGD
jgi:hypothetical protein